MDQERYESYVDAASALLSFFETLLLLRLPFRVYKARNINGLYVDSLLLTELALVLKYVCNWPEFSALEYKNIFPALNVQYKTKILVMFLLIFTCIAAAYRADHSNYKRDRFWIDAGIIGSICLGDDIFKSNKYSIWMISSYLEIVAWLPQIQLVFQSTFNAHDIVLEFLIGMSCYDYLNITSASYDYYQYKMFGVVGHKFFCLKLIIKCIIFLKCTLKTRRNNRINPYDQIHF